MNNNVVEKNYFKQREKNNCKKLSRFNDIRYNNVRHIKNDNYEKFFNFNYRNERFLQNRNFKRYDDDDDVYYNANKNQLFELIVSINNFKLFND